MSTARTPTDTWLAARPDMPALTGPAGVAERLLLLIHYGIDWQHGWIRNHRTTYWAPLLPDRVIYATFVARNLRAWWTAMSDELQSEPRTAAERRELEQLLRPTASDRAVLQLLRSETPALLLRTRLTAEAVRTLRDARQSGPGRRSRAR